MTRIGILGGSFNPAHRGHRAITLAAIDALALDEAWWLVSPGNPLKDAARDMAPLAARLASARAMARRAPIRATDIETRLHTRYTLDTIRKLKRRYPKNRFIWLMGADNLAEFHRWKNWRQIAREVPIAVIARPGYDGRALAALIHRCQGHLDGLVVDGRQGVQLVVRADEPQAGIRRADEHGGDEDILLVRQDAKVVFGVFQADGHRRRLPTV